MAAPPPPPPPPAPTPPPSMLTMGYNFGVRLGFRLQDPDQPKKMSELHLDPYGYDSTVEARFHGTAFEHFAWVANFNAVINTAELAPAGAVGIMDLIAEYKAVDEFQIWAGRLLVPSDRSNFSGPFFMSPWNYPGFYFPGAPPLGPKDFSNGRDVGVTVWGNALDDKLKYYGGVYGLGGSWLGSANGTPFNQQDQQAYWSGRISYTLQGSEPGYFGSSTYYGAKSVATIGVGAQYQKDGSIDTGTMAKKDTTLFMADALVEEVVPGAGTFTFEGQYYHFNDGYNFGPTLAPANALYAVVSYLTAEPIGIGKLQPLVRLQQTIDPAWTIFDAALAYVIKDYGLRIVTTYEHIDRGSGSTAGANPVQNSLQFGIQLQNL
jgi:hypothetical protein